MITVLMVIHFIVATLLVGIILLQKNEQGALGGLSGGAGGVMSARGAANFLTRGTAILAGCFFFTSLTLALLFRNAGQPQSFVDSVAVKAAADVERVGQEDIDRQATLSGDEDVQGEATHTGAQE